MSIEQGMLIVIAVSALFVPLWFVFPSRAFRFGMSVVIPLIVALGLYWGPDLRHIHDAEYHAWAGLFIPLWFVPAALTSLALTLCIDIWRKKRKSQKKEPSV